MTPLDAWGREVDAAVAAFVERAERAWQHAGDLDPNAPIEPYPGDGPLDRAYRAGIVPPERRWRSDFTDRWTPRR